MRVIEHIPDEAFISVRQIYDIAEAIIQKTEPDSVKILSVITGLVADISRKEFTEQFRWLDRRKINLWGCKRNRKYIVLKPEDAPCKAAYIPRGYKLCLNGKEEIIDGDESCFVIQDDRYEGVFTIPTSHFRIGYEYAESPKVAADRLKQLAGKEKPAHIQVRVKLKKDGTVGQVSSQQPHKPIQYKAVARYMRGKTLLGFKLLSTQKEYTDATVQVAAKLAMAERIVNLAFSSGGTNTAHFRGKGGSSLNDLPIIPR